MANQLHLLLRPDDANESPQLMHCVGWYSAKALNRLSGLCGHFGRLGITPQQLLQKISGEC
jgi:hypothetical protein